MPPALPALSRASSQHKPSDETPVEALTAEVADVQEVDAGDDGARHFSLQSIGL